jgi:carbonic anhydrase/acetyltransferase-like protein (isoleucine patch superfamily)
MKPEAFVNEPCLIPYHGKWPDVGNEVFIADTARVIGDVVLGEGTSVWYGAVVRGDVFHIRIGCRVNIQDQTMVHVTTGRYATVIEDDVTIGHRAILHGCTIKRGALIGMGATVMDGAVVGQGAMIGAGALVTPKTQVTPNTLWVGSPARMKRPLSDEEQAHLAQSAEHYYNLAQTYLTQGLGCSEGEV